ncbi:MAG: endonuclease/exonuclease/phosphatase family protein [Candidatus Neomarinimicrobiota bacterium]
MKSRIIIIGVFLTLLLLSGCGRPAEPLTVGFWNVENLFDLEDDPATNDEEFAAGGRKQVTVAILKQKLEHLSEVLSDLDADVVGLVEVENRAVLEMLNRQFPGRDYSIVHYDSPDERGIDCALLYDAQRFRVLSSEPIPVDLGSAGPTRDILYIIGKYAGKKLHLFVNHWPSHYGGTEATIPLRAKAARTLRTRVDQILAKDHTAEILIMGDLNDGPTDPSVHAHLGAVLNRPDPTAGTTRKEPCSEEQRLACGGCDGEGHGLESERVLLWNLMAPFEGKVNGTTYKYRGRDANLDQMIVSPGLADDRGLRIVENSLAIMDKPKYRQQGGEYRGYPYRFWAGDRLLGGYSDHLALRVLIERQ